MQPWKSYSEMTPEERASHHAEALAKAQARTRKVRGAYLDGLRKENVVLDVRSEMSGVVVARFPGESVPLYQKPHERIPGASNWRAHMKDGRKVHAVRDASGVWHLYRERGGNPTGDGFAESHGDDYPPTLKVIGNEVEKRAAQWRAEVPTDAALMQRLNYEIAQARDGVDVLEAEGHVPEGLAFELAELIAVREFISESFDGGRGMAPPKDKQTVAIEKLEDAGFSVVHSWHSNRYFDYDNPDEDARTFVLSKRKGCLITQAEVDPDGYVNGTPVDEYLGSIKRDEDARRNR